LVLKILEKQGARHFNPYLYTTLTNLDLPDACMHQRTWRLFIEPNHQWFSVTEGLRSLASWCVGLTFLEGFGGFFKQKWLKELMQQRHSIFGTDQLRRFLLLTALKYFFTNSGYSEL